MDYLPEGCPADLCGLPRVHRPDGRAVQYRVASSVITAATIIA